MIPGSANPLLLKSAAAGGYQIERSLRFNSSDSGFCSRTPAVAGNRKTWTWAGWVKRSALNAARQAIFTASNGSSYWGIEFDASSGITIHDTNSAGTLVTSAVHRDVSAWYHIVVTLDTTQTTAANRVKLYVNGTQVTTFGTTNYPSQNSDSFVNAICLHALGSWLPAGAGLYLDGYLADIHFIDGQALTPSSFTEVSATTGHLIPKAYTGSFGTNGFWLKFSDNSAATAATLGKDYSGNSNNWTPNNLSVTAGAGNDSLVDTPTSIAATDTGVGGEVRGNYATLNPLEYYGGTTTFTNGNLEVAITSGGGKYPAVRPTINLFNQGTEKYYSEITIGSKTSSFQSVGANIKPDGMTDTGDIYVIWRSDGVLSEGGVSATRTGTGVSYTNGDIIGVAYNNATQELKFYKNNSLVVTWAFTTIPVGFNIYCGTDSSAGTGNFTWNFGQRAFAYTAPSGFKALCDTNLGAPLVAKPNTLMDVVLYTGNGSTQTISGLGFSPDFAWFKSRSAAENHVLSDSVRGADRQLFSNLTNAEQTNSTYVTSFTADGFSLGSNTGTGGNNINGSTYAAWAWDAGSSTVSNTSGSITSQVRANPTAGFSVVTYTGAANTPSSIGHGLNAVPQFVIVKPRTTSDFWVCYHSAFNDLSKYIVLSSTNAVGTAAANYWGTSADWTSSTFGVYPLGGANNNLVGVPTVAYCFSPVVGYSSFGSYTGNGLADGPFVYTGFRPAYVLLKATAAVEGNWVIYDYNRGSFNLNSKKLGANLAVVENEVSTLGGDSSGIDFLSNGFKIRTTGPNHNNSSVAYIYASFAENPFPYARAR